MWITLLQLLPSRLAQTWKSWKSGRERVKRFWKKISIFTLATRIRLKGSLSVFIIWKLSSDFIKYACTHTVHYWYDLSTLWMLLYFVRVPFLRKTFNTGHTDMVFPSMNTHMPCETASNWDIMTTKTTLVWLLSNVVPVLLVSFAFFSCSAAFFGSWCRLKYCRIWRFLSRWWFITILYIPGAVCIVWHV